MIPTKNIFFIKSPYFYTSIKKITRILQQIAQKHYLIALKILEFLPYAYTKEIWNFIYRQTKNFIKLKNLKKKNIYIYTAKANKGSQQKRINMRTKGKFDFIKKPSCSIQICLYSKIIE